MNGYQMPPITVRKDLDADGLTAHEFRVLGHLASRTTAEAPTVKAIADRCFKSDSNNYKTRMAWTGAALCGLVKKGWLLLSPNNLTLEDLSVGAVDSPLVSFSLITKGEQNDSTRDDFSVGHFGDDGRSVWGQNDAHETTRNDNAETVAMRDFLLPLLYGVGTSGMNLLGKGQLANAWRVAAKLVKAGVTERDVEDWRKNVWVKEWPGNQGQRPKPTQVQSGVAAHLEAIRKKREQFNVRIVPASDGMYDDL